jgi:hypothetical protein
MTRDQLIELLGYRLGDRTDMVQRALAEMPLIQASILDGNKWKPWFLEKDFNGVTVVGQETVNLPEDFLTEIEESHLWITTAEGKRLRLLKKDLDVMRAWFTEAPSGQPQCYARLKGKIYLGPVPDAEYALTMQYCARDTDMSAANTETEWLKHAADVVMAELGYVLAAKHIQIPELAAGFQQDALRAWDRLYVVHCEQQETNQLRAMGGND